MSNPLPDPLPPNYHEFVAACFLGPRAENDDTFRAIFDFVLKQQALTREDYHPEDGKFITPTIKASQKFQDTIGLLQEQVGSVSNLLSQYSVPFFSPRYMGHMCMEMSMPSMVGWLATILYNPNNVAFEASPITTVIELEVGQQLCEMLGYTHQDNLEPWGHIAADGTLANMESMWAARNLKFYPLSLHAAMTKGDKPLGFISDSFMVPTPDNPSTPQLFSALTPWQLLNLSPSVVLDIPDKLLVEYSITSTFLADALSPYLAQTTGKDALMNMYNVVLEPQYFVPSTKHYSWPKAAALIGIGSTNCDNVPVDNAARMEITELEKKLQLCLDMQQAVYAVVAVIGSTEEGAVDPLADILKVRDEFAKKGLSFVVHADAAWGGYFASMIRQPRLRRLPRLPDRDYVPSVTLRKNTVAQFEALAGADSITIDPHKAGYIPYPAGGLCYRDGRMRYLLTWSAPYLHQSQEGESIGIYGIEGSKPGAPAVACYLHHSVLGLDTDGHGALLGEVSFTCRRFGAQWAAMSDDTTDFIVVPFNPLEREADKEIIRTRILPKTNEEVVQDQEAFKVLCTLGSDLNINAFACNFRINGQVNDDVEEANYLNARVFERLSITLPDEDPRKIPLFLSSTAFAEADYGECARNLKRRLGLETDSQQSLFVLRNVVMSPFQAAGNFVQELADIFRKVLEEEVKNVISRNTVRPQLHEFIMQGADALYLTYRPLFYNANGRYQLIVRANISDANKQSEYSAARNANPEAVFKLVTAEPTTIEKILADKSFQANISGPGMSSGSVSISIVEVVKDRPLDSRHRAAPYPASYTPFYVYGTPNEIDIDHVLVRAPNAQISSDRVALDVQPALTASDLARGVIARVLRPEAAMQPFTADHMVFRPDASFPVEVFTDVQDGVGTRIAQGTLTMGKMVFVDCVDLNEENFFKTPRSVAGEKTWAEVVKEKLGRGVLG
ncbi:pyridoxal phosphate-dependent transferase [Mycena haematopus]|nr:pyridoxal phosphate-dependent transferase [Mycena haematopus]